jgi:uncharacterized membrane protein YoaK (UPF0700 family)
LTPVRALTAGLILTATAGFSDGLGFLALGGFYTSFMSGNTTQLGAGVASGAWGTALLSGSLVVLFFIGSFLGSLAVQSSRRFGPAAATAIVLVGLLTSLGLGLAGYPAVQSLLSLAAAAGAQNAVLQPIGAARLGATFVTGTLFAAGQDLARATTGTAPPWRWLQHLVVWGALCGGAILGALAYSRWHMAALTVPAVVYAICLIWLSSRRV